MKPTTHPQKIQQLQTDMAVLKQTVSTLEHTVVAQNAAVRQELASINTVLREIHDKLDKVTLDHAIELVRQSEAHKALSAEVSDNTKEIERVDNKISRAGGALFALFLALLSGVIAWFSPK